MGPGTPGTSQPGLAGQDWQLAKGKCSAKPQRGCPLPPRHRGPPFQRLAPSFSHFQTVLMLGGGARADGPLSLCAAVLGTVSRKPLAGSGLVTDGGCLGGLQEVCLSMWPTEAGAPGGSLGCVPAGVGGRASVSLVTSLLLLPPRVQGGKG